MLDSHTNKNYKGFCFIEECLGGTFNQSMKHLENISYHQGAKMDKKNRNLENGRFRLDQGFAFQEGVEL